MPYHPPSLEELRTLSADYLTFYPDKPNYQVDTERFSMIVFCDHLARQTRNINHSAIQNVLMGCEVFKLASIKYGDRYKGSSPKQGMFTFTGGSSFYTTCKQKLNITKENRLGHDQKLIYLCALRSHVVQFISDDAIQLMSNHALLKNHDAILIWSSKQNLLDKIDFVIQRVLEKGNANLDKVIHSVPVLDSLQKSIETIKDKSSKTNPARIHQAAYCAFISQSIRQGEMSNAWELCTATMVNLMMEIDQEYSLTKKWPICWGPKNSDSFNLATEALNKELEDIKPHEKYYLFNELNNYLTVLFAEENKELYANLLDAVIAENNALELSNKSLAEKRKDLQEHIRQFRQDIQLRFKILEEEMKTNSSWLAYGAEKLTTCTVQLGLTSLLYQGTRLVTANLGVVGLFSRTALGSALAVFSPGGALLLSGLGTLVAAKSIEKGSAQVFAWMLARVGGAIAAKAGQATAFAVNCMFSTTPEGLHELRKNLSAEEDKIFVDWINCLLSLHLVLEQDKQHIRSVLHLADNEKLSPLVREEVELVSLPLAGS